MRLSYEQLSDAITVFPELLTLRKLGGVNLKFDLYSENSGISYYTFFYQDSVTEEVQLFLDLAKENPSIFRAKLHKAPKVLMYKAPFSDIQLSENASVKGNTVYHSLRAEQKDISRDNYREFFLKDYLLKDVRVFLAFPGLYESLFAEIFSYESRYKMPPNVFFEAVNRFERFKQELLQEALRDPYRHFGHPPGTITPDEL